MTAVARPPIIVGGALAGLVAALELDRAGRPVTLVNPGGPWGGYFAGAQADGMAFDVGMVMFEFTAFAEQAGREALASYDPGVRNDIGRFAGLTGDWVESLSPTRTIDPPSMLTPEGLFPDLIMGNALDALRDLPCAQAIRDDLRRRPEPGALHARLKARGPGYDEAVFEAASRANHGEVLHAQLMAPWLAKVFGDQGDGLLARYHRIPWLPLYWPETLLQVLDGAPSPIAPSPLNYPVGRTIAEFVADLVGRLASSPRVRLIEAQAMAFAPAGRGGALTLSTGEALETDRLAWSHAPGALARLLGAEAEPPTSRAPLAIALLSVPRTAAGRPFSVLQILDPDVGVYRVTDLDVCAGLDPERRRWAVELNLEVFAAAHPDALADEAILAAVAADLAALGLMDGAEAAGRHGLKRVPGGFAIPDAAALGAWMRERATLDAGAPGVTLMAAGSGFMVTSLGDQIVQGLKFADEVIADAD